MAEKAMTPFDEVEWELIRADIAELKAKAEASGAWSTSPSEAPRGHGKGPRPVLRASVLL